MQRLHLPLPPVSPAEHAAHEVIRQLRASGHEAYAVGGCVRDRLLSRVPTEVDVATSATPAQVQARFPHTVAVGAAFGVIVVISGDVQTEVATFREDCEYRDGRHPAGVRFSDAAADASRRDFTVNALFYDPAAETLVDFVGGLDDLRCGVIRAVGEPARRFQEDRLRLLRAVRFAARLDFVIEPATATAIPPLAAGLAQLSAERIFMELDKMLRGPRPERAFALLFELGLLAVALPELAALHGVPQPPAHHPEGDVWTHTLLLLRHLVAPTAALAWAALLHDVGKPAALVRDPDGTIRSPEHARLGADLARAVLRRLRATNQLTDAVTAMVGNHMGFVDVQRMRPATVRRLLARETFALELELHRLDCAASHRRFDNYVFLLDRLAEFRQTPPVPAPLLTGRDVLAAGLAPGPRVGELLRAAQELQLNGELASREAALAWLACQLPPEAPPDARP